MCRQLKNYGVDIENDSLRLDIIDKMPAAEKDKLTYIMVTSPGTTTESILQKMEFLILKAEIVSQNQQKFQNTSPNMNHKNNLPNFKNNDSSFTQQHGFHPNNYKPGANFKPTVTAGKIKCSLCDDNHYSSTCPKYFTADDKLKQLRSRNFCTKCLRNNHDTNSCFAKIVCNLCQGNHHTCLCKTKTVPTKSSAFINVEKKKGMLLTKEVVIYNPISKETAETVVIFDSGSQQSYISNKLIKQLKLETIEEEKLNVTGFGAKTSIYNSSLVKFEVKTQDGLKSLYANSTQKIATAVPVVCEETFKTKDIKMIYKTPEILIGMDYFLEFISSFEKAGDDIYIVNSCVGKMLCKNIAKDKSVTVSSLAIESQQINETENELQKFWSLENMGIKDPETNDEETTILEKFKESIKFKDNRYYVSWPEKQNHPELPTNAGLALGRLNSTFKKLSNDPKLLKDCDNIINEQKERGTIEIAPEKPDGKLIHYLSSHAVVNPQKTTTKVRMVFDASAKISKDSPSLNDFLIRGPLNMPDLGGILLRIRRGHYMLVGDIEKAFHQVYLNEESRDAVRFFWAKDPTKPLTKDNLITYRFIGVPFGVISSPFILWIIILIHLQKLDNEKFQQIHENFYVDNIFLLVDDKNEAIEQFKIIRDHFLQASMNIREWLSNDAEVNEAFPKEIRQKSNTSKILGLNWDSENDTLQVELKQISVTENWTKRKILKFIASTFDPLGLLSPVTVKGRIFMQNLFKEKLTWDEPLNEELLRQWNLILKDWNGSIDIPRKYVENKFPDNSQIEIHAFADASPHAYFVYAYAPLDINENIVTFFETKMNEKHEKILPDVINIESHGEYCVIANLTAEVAGPH
uniref:Reverse transcriptase domain-containing protein n=1 Tax=Panagrolaimus sp. PS1159 TaxID=55785 RepID=A0AC35FRU3_9BILA